MKKFLFLIATLLLHLHVHADTWDGVASDKSWYDATQTEFHIYNAAQLKGVADLVNNDTITFDGCSIYLEDDIDLNSKLWTPIGYGDNIPKRDVEFKGCFYGQGYRIDNIYIDTYQLPSVWYEVTIGLFGYFVSGIVSDLNVSAYIINQGYGYTRVGGIGGKGGRVIRCSSKTTIEHNPGSALFKDVYLGFLVGYADEIEYCEAQGNITYRGYLDDGNYVGGVAGYATIVKQCSSKGYVAARGSASGGCSQVGGICGAASFIEDCIFSGVIDAYDYSKYASHMFAFGICPGPRDLVWGGECSIHNVISVPSSFSSNTQYSTYKGLLASNSNGVSVSNAFYVNELAIGNEQGTGLTRDYLKSGTPLEGFDTSIWEFKENEYPSLIALRPKLRYTLTYYVDNEIYKESNITEGVTIKPEKEPTKKGYTFSGWSEIPNTMPAHNVTVTGHFTINKYKLTYIVDADDYNISEVEYGTAIKPLPEPTKEGYTFSGWSEIPETMPDHDVVVTGNFTINKYKLTYVIDGVKYKSYDIEYGTAITPEAEPTKEGYTFSGWSWIPQKMPAEDVTVTGSFDPNNYKLTYIVDGVVYKSYDVPCGSLITQEAEPTKEGYSFSGWSYIPSKMPAENVTVTGKFTVNKYKVTYIIDGEEYKTEEVEYGSVITPPNPGDREGYDFSWGDYPNTMPAKDITIIGSYTVGIMAVLASESDVKIFTVSGKPISKLQKGVNILRYKDGRTKKIVIK